MYYWKANSNDGAYEDTSKQDFETKQEAYEDMRETALTKMMWNTQFDEDFEDEDEVIDYKIYFSQNKIVHESYSGVYTYEIYKRN